ncbi:hypothetical protein [Nannocystis pusilla]|uniref:hypothetical protein n=1 Tax=Nannocystis pusilla TaxID=889268 RepID=UPI003B7E6D15
MASETDGPEITVLARRLGELGTAGLAEQLRREGAELLAEAVARSEAALSRDPGQLAAHLAGRLGGQLPAGVFAGHARAWLRPLSNSLEPPHSPLRATLQEHGAEVRAVLVMPDGQTLLSSAEDGRVLRWDLASEALLGELVGHEATVNAMALTPAGDLLLTASDDLTIGLWDTAQWRLVDQLRGHTHYVRLALAGAAGLVVSASNDGTIRVWDLAERRELRVIAGHSSAITAMTLLDGGLGSPRRRRNI